MTDVLTPSEVVVGDSAPDLTLRDAGNAEVRLSDLWSSAPRALVIVFLRHFG